MGKLGAILWVIGGVTAVYLVLLITVPFLMDIALSTNATLDASTNMSNYPGTSGFLLSSPWILFFAPAAIGIAAIIIILRQRDDRGY